MSIPGRPVVCRRGEQEIEPYGDVDRARQDDLATAQWVESMQRLGAAQLPLVPYGAGGRKPVASAGGAAV